eukprot:gene4977-5788_t
MTPIDLVKLSKSEKPEDQDTLGDVRERVKRLAIESTRQAPRFKDGDHVRIRRGSLPVNKKNAFFKPVDAKTVDYKDEKTDQRH